MRLFHPDEGFVFSGDIEEIGQLKSNGWIDAPFGSFADWVAPTKEEAKRRPPKADK